ncbi:restriction endonuclease subunit S [Streptomyces sp. NPDC093060]|uniref:restriction endonuclease subunit S n=1 Tax=Streptomyces sp. NPDC093060 TaxID=3366019 RepID=UPI0037FCDE2D
MDEESIPSSWTWVELGEVAESVRNGIYVSRPGATPDGVPILRIGAVRPMRLDLSDLRYTGMDATEVKERDGMLTPGDLLFTRYNGNPEFVGACARVPDGAGGLTYPDKLIRVRLVPGLFDSRFVSYAWASESVRRQVRKFVKTSAGQVGIAGGSLKKVRLPLPPLAEQHRIVEALEEQLSRLEAAVANLDAGQRRAQQLGTAALTTSLDKVGGVPSRRLGDLLKEPLRNGHSAKATTDPAGIRTLNLTAVTKGEFSNDNTKLTVADPHRVRDLWLTRGDILVQRSNTPELVGTTAMYDGSDGWAIFPDLLIRVRVNDDVLSEYVTLILQSRRGRSYFKSRAKGLAGSMPKIDQSTIENFTIPVPPLEVQERVVAEVRYEMDRVARVSLELHRARRRSVGLRNALLRTAFNGKLVPQDLSDEAAHVALARVAAERAGQSKAKRPRKTAPKELTKAPAPRAAEASSPAPEPTSAPVLAVQQEFDL